MVLGHILCLPFPAQGHINPMLKLSILLHHKGFHITFVHTQYNYKRLIKSKGSNHLKNLQNFQYKTIPDGLSPSDDVHNGDSTQNVTALCESVNKNCLDPLLELVRELNNDVDGPVITCMIVDCVMSFGLKAAEEIGVAGVSLRTANGCSMMCYQHVKHLVQKGIVPFKDESDLTNGYLDMPIEIPGMINIRLKDFPSFIRTTNPNDSMLNIIISESSRMLKASAIMMNTFDALEHNVLQALSPICPPIYPIGPLNLLIDQLLPNSSKSIGSSLWKEELECLQWLNTKEANSVIYVNFGSVAVLSPERFRELAWGLVNSEKNFLWIIRADLVAGDSENDFSGDGQVLPVIDGRGRGLIAKWCPQEEVLKHPSIGGFLTHCGWNSMLESLCSGVPLLCWPFLADQHINCRYACNEWGIGMEIDEKMKRDEMENLVRELIDGEKGKEMRKKSVEWKKMGEEAIGKDGSSFLNFEKVINEVLLSKSI